MEDGEIIKCLNDRVQSLTNTNCALREVIEKKSKECKSLLVRAQTAESTLQPAKESLEKLTA